MNYNRYNNGKIYQIINNIDDMVYIGSTCLPLKKRIYNHKEEYHAGKGPNRRLFQHAQKYGWAEFDIILIEEYPCENRDLVGAALRYRRLLLGLPPLHEATAALQVVQVQRRDPRLVEAQLLDVEAVELLRRGAIRREPPLLPLPRVVNLNTLRPARPGYTQDWVRQPATASSL